MTARTIVVLGSTGSIGVQALDLAARNRQLFTITGLAAGGSQLATLAEQVISHQVHHVAINNPAARDSFPDELARAADAAKTTFRPQHVSYGPDAVTELAASTCDVVVNGIEGAAGIEATLATLDGTATLALANKESLIMTGDIILDRIGTDSQGTLMHRIAPVDSEHSALAQALRGERLDDVAKLIVTASGGPFRGRSRNELANVTVEEALNHPTWSMGPLVTINSATLVNKSLEVMEAHLLFGIDYSRIDVSVHPQSIVHSAVEFVDGSTMAQCSPPDMRIPIALGMNWPHRVPGAATPCDWTTPAHWTFSPLDNEAFPAVTLARHVGTTGGTFPAVYNAANEAAVAAFRAGTLRFIDIVDMIQRAVDAHTTHELAATRSDSTPTVDHIRLVDQWARDFVNTTQHANMTQH